MSKFRVAAISAFVGALGFAHAAGAQTFLTANLINGNEPGPIVPTTTTGAPRPASFGTASFVINAAMTQMTFTATVFNIDFTGTQTADINDNLTVAHIHAGPGATPTFPVVWGFFGNPFNDNNPNDVLFSPFASGVGGTISGKWDAAEGQNTTLAAQLPNILSNHAYINFHTTQFGGGEVRGTLVVVPEPSTVVLMAGGLLAVGLVGRSRRKGQALV